MELRRRNFLGLMGAAAAAPMMPGVAVRGAAYSRASYFAAIAHAQKYPMVSIGGMVRWLGVNADQAEAILDDMDRAGLVSIRAKPSMRNGVHAASKILKGDHWGVVRTAQPRPNAANVDSETQSKTLQDQRVEEAPQGEALTRHLYAICVSQGLCLDRRCAA